MKLMLRVLRPHWKLTALTMALLIDYCKKREEAG